jgi:hypothetical protein
LAQLVERQELHGRETRRIDVDFVAEVQGDRIVQVDGAAVDRLGPDQHEVAASRGLSRDTTTTARAGGESGEGRQ